MATGFSTNAGFPARATSRSIETCSSCRPVRKISSIAGSRSNSPRSVVQYPALKDLATTRAFRALRLAIPVSRNPGSRARLGRWWSFAKVPQPASPTVMAPREGDTAQRSSRRSGFTGGAISRRAGARAPVASANRTVGRPSSSSGAQPCPNWSANCRRPRGSRSPSARRSPSSSTTFPRAPGSEGKEPAARRTPHPPPEPDPSKAERDDGGAVSLAPWALAHVSRSSWPSTATTSYPSRDAARTAIRPQMPSPMTTTRPPCATSARSSATRAPAPSAASAPALAVAPGGSGTT